MKKAVLILAIVLGLQGLAETDDVFAVCKTEGATPDCYADGRPVADGECYALVYTKAGAKFAGFKADGSLVTETDELVLVLPKAKNGHCAPTLCVLRQAFVDARKGGQWRLYLLDTRMADGSPAGLDSAGRLRRVNGWGETSMVFDYSTRNPFAQQTDFVKGLAQGVVADVASEFPEGAVRPRISGIAVDDERQVRLTVADTLDYCTYGVEKVDLGDKPAARELVQDELRDGDSRREIAIDANGRSAQLFRVVVVRRGFEAK